MKRTVLLRTALVLAAGLLCIQPLANAADEYAASDRATAARERMQEVAKKLNLTDKQKEKLKPIFQEELEKLKTIRDDSSLSRLQKARKLKALRDEVTPKVKEVLTPEQFEKWVELRKENREELRKRFGK